MRGERDDKLWSPATAVNVVLNAQWAMYQLLRQLGLRPDAVVGHSSGELLALSAAGVFPADRVLEQKLGSARRDLSQFRNHRATCPRPTWSPSPPIAHASKASAARLAAEGTAVAMDNCPHQVVLAVPNLEFEPLVARLRAESILWEDSALLSSLPHPELRAGCRPDRRFLRSDDLQSASTVPIYSCASSRRMPDDVASIRDLAVRQWTTTVAFRETIEAMHSDGLRLFVDVGARGNLAGFVEDILRGKPSFAVAANLPRRSGLAQLNHLVASTFRSRRSLEYATIFTPAGALAPSIGTPPSRPPGQLSSWRSAFRRCGFRSRSWPASALRGQMIRDPSRTATSPSCTPACSRSQTTIRTRNGSSRHHDVDPQPAPVVAPDEPRFDALEERFRNTPLDPAACASPR